MPCCAALCYAVGQEHQAENNRGKRIEHAKCGGQSVESVGRACCVASDQTSELMSCDVAVGGATKVSVQKGRGMHDQVLLLPE